MESEVYLAIATEVFIAVITIKEERPVRHVQRHSTPFGVLKLLNPLCFGYPTFSTFRIYKTIRY
jgi:hypothetical protein